MQPFTPATGATQTISATAVSGLITLSVPGANADQVLLTNAGPNTVFWRAGDGAVVSIAAVDCPILPGAAVVFSTGPASVIAAICAGGQTATLYVTPGLGE